MDYHNSHIPLLGVVLCLLFVRCIFVLHIWINMVRYILCNWLIIGIFIQIDNLMISLSNGGNDNDLPAPFCIS